jgi:hypothetical protein
MVIIQVNFLITNVVPFNLINHEKYIDHLRNNYFNSDMSKSANTVVFFDWKMVIYIYACGQCHTQFMLSHSSR